MLEKKKTTRRQAAGTPRRLTERQRAARSRQLQESRAMTKDERRARATDHHELSDRQKRAGGPRVTGLIVDELGKALATVLKLDGPADVYSLDGRIVKSVDGKKELNTMPNGVYIVKDKATSTTRKVTIK